MVRGESVAGRDSAGGPLPGPTPLQADYPAARESRHRPEFEKHRWRVTLPVPKRDRLEGEMRIAVVLISIVLVLGLAVGGYEINHQRTEIDGLQTQVTTLNKQVTSLDKEVSQIFLAEEKLLESGKL
jgi:outer membrane murein-binding lipoprotein Lpp